MELEKIYTTGNKTLGIIPCSKRRVAQHEKDPAIVNLPPTQRFEKAKLMAVGELGMTEQNAAMVQITNTFFPRYEGKKKVMYVQFANLDENAKITSRANLLEENLNFPEKSPQITM